MAFKSDFLNVLSERGFLHQQTDADGLDAALTKGVISGYVGFDATASSLHVGNLISITLLRWLQKTGHRPIALLGGGTTKIGDPSGKDEARPVITDEFIADNKRGIQKNFEQYLEFGDGQGMLVDNADWLDKLEYIPFLREVGRHFSVNRMLTMDSVKLRLEREQPLSFLEFNYMILQGYDFVELYKRYGTVLQMGGSDQWGNIIGGVDLGRRLSNAQLFGLTTPLITTAGGAKMGKSANGAVWLSAEKLSPYDYYQYFRNTADADVAKFLALFTELPMSEVQKLGALQGQEINEAKKILALEATRLCHGNAGAEAAAQTAQQVFEQGSVGDGLERHFVNEGQSLVDALVLSKIVESKSEAKRLIKGGGVKINDQKVESENYQLSDSDLNTDKESKVSIGKKRNIVFVWDRGRR